MRLSPIGPDGQARLAAAPDIGIEPPMLGLLSPETTPLLPAALDLHRRAPSANVLTLLVPPAAPPDISMRKDGPVVAFIASGPWTVGMTAWEEALPAELCYRAVACVLSAAHEPIELNIVHRPVAARIAPTGRGISVEAIVPHRGSDDHLRVALAGLARQTLRCRTILCFDQPPDPDLCQALAREEGLDLFEVTPNPAGPYVARQHFTNLSTAHFLAFQDSDDFSLPSRVEELVAGAESQGADLAGCHELQCNELTRTVEAIRYPLDVNEALRSASGAAQLFPTTVARVDTLRRIGGFSTIRTFGADKQFHLRAYWNARMINLDSFLYVRRIRENSLTTSPETGMQSAVRQEITRAWKQAFQDVKDGLVTLAESALRIEHGRTDYLIRDLRTGEARPAMLRMGGGDPDNRPIAER